MLSSISPLGERARASRWSVTATAYVLGSLVGGLALGALSAAAGSLLPAAWRSSRAAGFVVAALLVTGLLLDLAPGGRALPSWRRQVDELWRSRYRGWVYGAGFGLQLGFGVVTIVTSATVYAVPLFAALSGHLGVGLALGACFGLLRAAPVLALARVHDRRALHALFAVLHRWEHGFDLSAKAALGLAAVAVTAATAFRGA